MAPRRARSSAAAIAAAALAKPMLAPKSSTATLELWLDLASPRPCCCSPHRPSSAHRAAAADGLAAASRWMLARRPLPLLPSLPLPLLPSTAGAPAAVQGGAVAAGLPCSLRAGPAGEELRRPPLHQAEELRRLARRGSLGPSPPAPLRHELRWPARGGAGARRDRPGIPRAGGRRGAEPRAGGGDTFMLQPPREEGAAAERARPEQGAERRRAGQGARGGRALEAGKRAANARGMASRAGCVRQPRPRPLLPILLWRRAPRRPAHEGEQGGGPQAPEPAGSGSTSSSSLPWRIGAVRRQTGQGTRGPPATAVALAGSLDTVASVGEASRGRRRPRRPPPLLPPPSSPSLRLLLRRRLRSSACLGSGVPRPSRALAGLGGGARAHARVPTGMAELRPPTWMAELRPPTWPTGMAELRRACRRGQERGEVEGERKRREEG